MRISGFFSLLKYLRHSHPSRHPPPPPRITLGASSCDFSPGFRVSKKLPFRAVRHIRSGYEPSDTESEWQESPWHEGLLISNRPKTPDRVRTISPLSRSQRHSIKEDSDMPVQTSRTSPIVRRHNKSPYKPNRDGDDGISVASSGLRRNTSPDDVSDCRSRHISPFKVRTEEQNHVDNELNGSFRKRNQRTPPKFRNSMDKGSYLQPHGVSKVRERAHPALHGVSGMSERSNYSRRSMSAPKPRAREKEQQASSGPTIHNAGRRPSPLARSMMQKESGDAYERSYSPTEINETVVNRRLTKSPTPDALSMQSTDSISPGDIFFSRDYIALQKNSSGKDGDNGNTYTPQFKVAPEKNTAVHQHGRGTDSSDQIPQVVSVSTLSRTDTNYSSALSRSVTVSNYSGKLSDISRKQSGSFGKFTANRQRSQSDTWLSCVRRGSCRKAKSPDSRAINEASFIEKAFVVEELRPFWADKHSPRSLSVFTCHKHQARQLKQLISYNNCPHILFKGPSGSGKKSLSMALLHEIFGDSSWKISHEMRHFHVQETRPLEIAVPITSSPHHVELNLKSESRNARYALMALAKEIAGDRTLNPEVSEASFKADYKVLVLYDVDKVAESVQHLIKWIMDRYTDACKIILCCEDDACILDSVKNRCKVITVDAPVTHEIMEVLIHIAKKENFELSVNFAARIATKSKQNLRKAIMALEACKAHNYPFVDEQPIPLGWEEVLVEVAAEILADPSPKRLFLTRGKFQKLLVEFVNPRLILQKLVEQFLKGIETGLRRELYYWHAYYDKRLPIGTSALLKLEEFVAKFMSIYRKQSFSGSATE